MAMTHRDRARLAGQARQASMSPEQRTALGSRGYLASAVTAVVDRANELTEEQLTRLRAVLCGGATR